MKISIEQEFRRPVGHVVNAMCTPNRFKRVAIDMGAECQIVKGAPNPEWDCAIMWRDQSRQFGVRLDQSAAPEQLVFSITSGLAHATMVVHPRAIGENACAVRTEVDIAPRSMMVRIALQTLRLMKGETEDRLRRFVHAMGCG